MALHCGSSRTIRATRSWKAFSALVRRYRPLHVSIVGGEPLIRYRELEALLPQPDRMNIEVQLVTSAVRPIPAHSAALGCLHLVVSMDGLPEHHDIRRKPAPRTTASCAISLAIRSSSTAPSRRNCSNAPPISMTSRRSGRRSGWG